MSVVEYLALALIYEAAHAAEMDSEAVYYEGRPARWQVLDEIYDQPAPRGWRAQIATCSYRTWE